MKTTLVFLLLVSAAFANTLTIKSVNCTESGSTYYCTAENPKTERTNFYAENNSMYSFIEEPNKWNQLDVQTTLTSTKGNVFSGSFSGYQYVPQGPFHQIYDYAISGTYSITPGPAGTYYTGSASIDILTRKLIGRIKETTPEPGTWLTMLTGIGMVAGLARRKLLGRV